jgi:uncharacterized protein GlcG (DUF336 family)
MMSANKCYFTVVAVTVYLTACGGGSRDSEPGTAVIPSAVECVGSCVESQRNGNDDNVRLTVADVQTIIAQAVAEANAQTTEATIAVTDRVGNVLGVWRTSAAARNVLIASDPDGAGGSRVAGGLEGIEAGIDGLAAIAKAVTGAYLSSEGNAFTSRTASQIVQSHFNPGELFQPAGPLFGVQFSQLACSDFINAFDTVGPSVGPQRSPLGLSADPGGLPLYKNGTVVGGVGVIADDLYSLDLSIADTDNDIDELIAVAASFGFSAPLDRRANMITVEGKTFRFSDVGVNDLASNPANAPAFPPANGSLIAVTGYNNATINAGLVFGDAASGIRRASNVIANESAYVNGDGFVFVDAVNNNRFPATNGVTLGGNELLSTEVETILQEALNVANRARAQIRRPLGSQARVTISVVDTNGNILGIVRTRDAPVFGADVSLQKARTAAFFSSANAASDLTTPGIDARYINLQASTSTFASGNAINLGDYVTAVQNFLGSPTALADGAFAFSDRAGGNLSRPFFPDGIDGSEAGPLSKPQGFWSPFSTGLQLDMSINAILQHVLFAAGAIGTDVSTGCGGVIHNPFGTFAPSPLTTNHLANGIQIFPGSVPIYRGNVLIGGIGISGDGVDQDDMIAFLAVDQAAARLGNAINNAPAAIRSDQLEPRDVRLRFVQCPQAPYLDSDEQQPCEGK